MYDMHLYVCQRQFCITIGCINNIKFQCQHWEPILIPSPLNSCYLSAPHLRLQSLALANSVSIPPKRITVPFGLVFGKAHWLAVQNSVAVLHRRRFARRNSSNFLGLVSVPDTIIIIALTRNVKSVPCVSLTFTLEIILESDKRSGVFVVVFGEGGGGACEGFWDLRINHPVCG